MWLRYRKFMRVALLRPEVWALPALLAWALLGGGFGCTGTIFKTVEVGACNEERTVDILILNQDGAYVPYIVGLRTGERVELPTNRTYRFASSAFVR